MAFGGDFAVHDVFVEFPVDLEEGVVEGVVGLGIEDAVGVDADLGDDHAVVLNEVGGLADGEGDLGNGHLGVGGAEYHGVVGAGGVAPSKLVGALVKGVHALEGEVLVGDGGIEGGGARLFVPGHDGIAVGDGEVAGEVEVVAALAEVDLVGVGVAAAHDFGEEGAGVGLVGGEAGVGGLEDGLGGLGLGLKGGEAKQEDGEEVLHGAKIVKSSQ